MSYNYIGSIGLTNFVSHQFKNRNLRNVDPGDFLKNINARAYALDVLLGETIEVDNDFVKILDHNEWKFCRYLIFKNEDSKIKSSVAKLTLDMYPFIRTSYEARQEGELPVLMRWAELPKGFDAPVAKYIVCVLYSREHLLKEHNAIEEKQCKEDPERISHDFELKEDQKYGLVAILTCPEPNPDPILPITQMRNALGAEEGGNGQKINKEEYISATKFWQEHITLR